VAELRQIVAKTPIKTGITIPSAFFEICAIHEQRRPSIGSNMLMSGPFLMKLVAGLGKT
jgi:hypothetical protein